MKVLNIIMLVWCVGGMSLSIKGALETNAWEIWAALGIYTLLTVWWIYVIRTETVKK